MRCWIGHPILIELSSKNRFDFFHDKRPHRRLEFLLLNVLNKCGRFEQILSKRFFIVVWHQLQTPDSIHASKTITKQFWLRYRCIQTAPIISFFHMKRKIKQNINIQRCNICMLLAVGNLFAIVRILNARVKRNCVISTVVKCLLRNHQFFVLNSQCTTVSNSKLDSKRCQIKNANCFSI